MSYKRCLNSVPMCQTLPLAIVGKAQAQLITLIRALCHLVVQISHFTELTGSCLKKKGLVVPKMLVSWKILASVSNDCLLLCETHSLCRFVWFFSLKWECCLFYGRAGWFRRPVAKSPAPPVAHDVSVGVWVSAVRVQRYRWKHCMSVCGGLGEWDL